MEEQREHVSMSNNTTLKECSKLTEIHEHSSNPSCSDTNAGEYVQISNRNETGCSDAETIGCDKKDVGKDDVMDLLVKLGNDTVVYNISKSLERIRYMINNISVENILSSPILPHQRCVTYISKAQKTIKGNQKTNVFTFVSSYPSSCNLRGKYRVRRGVPVIIIGDITNIQEDQCSYVFICAYVNEDTVMNGKGLLGMCSASSDESSDSSDDELSTADSSEDSNSTSYNSSDENDDENNKKSNKIVIKQENFKPVAVDVRNPLVFLEDGAADKLPPIRECDMKVPKQDCIEIGYIMHIHELLVSVQGLKDSPALNADTLLFLDDNEDDNSLRSLGFIYEVIGPVGEPVYCITFKEEQNIEKKQIKQGAPVYIHPSPEHTHFVFVQDLLKQRGSDASWKNDVEPPEQFIEYSDDEEERLAKQRMKQASSKVPTSNAAVKRKNTEESNTGNAQGCKQIKVIQNSDEASKVVSACIPSQGSQVPPRITDRQHRRNVSSRMIGRGQRMHHAVEVSGEVNRSIPIVMHPGTSNKCHDGIGSQHVTGRGQQLPHAAQVNGEVNRSIPIVMHPGTSNNHHNGIGSHRQQIPHTVQEPRMQHCGFTVQAAGLVTPPRMQQYRPVNRHFRPRFSSNQQLIPSLQQQQGHFNRPSHPKCTSSFPSPRRQFYNPPR